MLTLRRGHWLLFLSFLSFAAQSYALQQATSATNMASDLKKLSLEELLRMEITVGSRKPRSFWKTAGALDVISSERIRRSGSLTLADALRLASGFHVVRFNSGSWGISAQGLNLNTANKLQVLMDGRSLYTPLFGGVFWDVQDYFLRDIDRIEVNRGPGATLWGANAVNGVINITTLHSSQTQGGIVEAGGGNEEKFFTSARYGDKWGDSNFYRGYFKFFSRDGLVLANGEDANGDWLMGRGGFRIDSKIFDSDDFTLQGDAYKGDFEVRPEEKGIVSGGNLMGTWNRTLNENSALQFLFYFDRSDRKIPLQFQEQRNTFNFELQHNFRLGKSHDIVWGGNYRISADNTENIGTISFDPENRTIHHLSTFVQDEFSIQPDRFILILGTKMEDNTFSGLEVQPNIRFQWLANEENTLWGSVARAVRVPSRLDTDFRFYPVPGFLALVGNPDFEPEELIAVQAGYRMHPHTTTYVDITTFYNTYDSLITLTPGAPGQPSIIGNDSNATTSGVTFFTRVDLHSGLRIAGSLGLLHKDLSLDPGTIDISNASGEGNDPDYFWMIQTMMEPVRNLQVDAVLRSSGELPDPLVPGYVTMDLHIAWIAGDSLEFTVVGQNLFQKSHPEFGPSQPTRQEVQRSFYSSLTWFF